MKFLIKQARMILLLVFFFGYLEGDGLSME